MSVNMSEPPVASTVEGDPKVVNGEFVSHGGERHYVIRNVDALAPFMVSVVSSDDHWLFMSSTGGVTAGRVSKEHALFPFVTVDKLHAASHDTGGFTLLRFADGDAHRLWRPLGAVEAAGDAIERNLYKSVLANTLCFEEIHHELGLAFRCTWMPSDRYGFVRQCEIENLGARPARFELIDGVRNVLPAGVPSYTQTNSSNLVNAYRWSELDQETGLATFSLYAGITDRAMPCESLRANTVFCLGLEGHRTLLSTAQIDGFYRGGGLETEVHQRGVRGAYLVARTLELAPGARQRWRIVADVEQTQTQVVAQRRELQDPSKVADAVDASVRAGTRELARIMGAADGFQRMADEMESAHHYANVLFNVLRGGIFDDQYRIGRDEFAASVAHFNEPVYERNAAFLAGLPERMDVNALLEAVHEQGDDDLERLARGYLPITFGRRHGDPSRPWNEFAIHLKDEAGQRLLAYQGNWRDIFQNWEALLVSYPEFAENVIAKFVNASTPDGYNPYRISEQGIDWEVEDPEDPWSYIGYWGDHQIIYLCKLLELSLRFHPERLKVLLRRPVFSYANVPYRIRPFAALLDNPKHTVDYDAALVDVIERRVARIGADGKLVQGADGQVVRVNLVEKLLVPVLTKLSNLVVDGGVWLNTQRPEWNDANNALVGHGLSMVTLNYLHRHLCLLQNLLAEETDDFTLSAEVVDWIDATASALQDIREVLGDGPVTPGQRLEALEVLGGAAERYRAAVYREGAFAATRAQTVDGLRDLLDDALAVIRHSIGTNRRADGLCHAYNLLRRETDGIAVDRLYPMLEGQVAALSSGAMAPADAVAVLDALYASEVYRADQHSFMLYPDRALPGFLEKNRVSPEAVRAIPLAERMVEAGDRRIIERDVEGAYRFNADFANVEDLDARLDTLGGAYGEDVERARAPLRELYESVFSHRSFTGRSGTMFGFEGLGCIYWHMVAKLLLAVQENYFAAISEGNDPGTVRRLGELYYRVRSGLGYHKTPVEYGTFPADPYSHTPKHAGARQPGMTGQVKEEILSRFGELGLRVEGGQVHFDPSLLRAEEFLAEPAPLRWVDVEGQWQSLEVPSQALAFTWCQVPVVYHLGEEDSASVTVTLNNGEVATFSGHELPPEAASHVARRDGEVRRIDVAVHPDRLYTAS